MAQFRKQRVGEMLRALLATELSRSLDPRFQAVTIVDVDVAPDLRNARVFWSYFVAPAPVADTSTVSTEGSEGNDPVNAAVRPVSESVISDLERALVAVKPHLKRAIAKQLELRYVPELHFRYDASAIQGSRIDLLLDRIRTN